MSENDFPRVRRRTRAEQVAAVCYRAGLNGIEFLLVQTGGGRWIFPKGNAEPELTHAQAAALEAFEEAGVHGRIEEVPFARYLSHKRNGGRTSTRAMVYAHLCEVSRLDPPQESGRNPTWFSIAKAKRRLQEARAADGGAELARVVDRAAVRIQRLGTAAKLATAPPQKDALQKVAFEAGDGVGNFGRMQEAPAASFSRYISRQRGNLRHSAIQLAVNAYLGEALRLRAATPEPTEIDSSWEATGGAKGLGIARKTTPKQLPN